MNNPATHKHTQYSVNGLTYTKMGLISLFAWLLWGDFCFEMMEMLKPKLLPLLLQGEHFGLNASSTALMIMFGTIPGITGLILGPAISFKSDRYRSPKGRRIPFIIWTIPLLAMSLFGIGMGPFYKVWFSSLDGMFGLTAAHYAILLIGLCVGLFHCMDEFVNSVFWYLFADVVPEEFLGRFNALFRLVSQGANVLFMFYVFPMAETHFHQIFFGFGLLYVVGFFIMCNRVKEGTYPPPDDIGKNPGILAQTKIYITECFSHKIYINIFLFSIFTYMGSTIAMTNTVIFHQYGLNLSLEEIGKWIGYLTIITVVLAYPAGWLVDRFNAIRITLVMLLPVIIFQAISFFLMKDLKTFIILEGGRMIGGSLMAVAVYPMLIGLFPKDKFGQFCSCNGAMRSVAMMLAAPVIGIILDQLTNRGLSKFDFRWTYMIGAICQVSAIYFLLQVYSIWKSRGGAESYVPPGSALEKQQQARTVVNAPTNVRGVGGESFPGITSCFTNPLSMLKSKSSNRIERTTPCRSSENPCSRGSE